MMKKSLIAMVVAGSVLTTSALAWGGNDCPQDRGFKKRDKRGFKGDRGGLAIMPMLRDLDLSKTQKEKIRNIMIDNRKSNYVSISSAFSKASFDKQKYASIISSRFDNRHKNKAELIEKVYNVLNSSQKIKLKSLLEQRDEDFQKRLEKRR